MSKHLITKQHRIQTVILVSLHWDADLLLSELSYKKTLSALYGSEIFIFRLVSDFTLMTLEINRNQAAFTSKRNFDSV